MSTEIPGDEVRRGPGRPPGTRNKATDAPPMRSDQREEQRGDMHPSLASADQRAQEILEHLGDMDEGQDEFSSEYLASVTPPGWSYEWKRHRLLGKDDPAYQVQLARTGWTAVPANRHPEMMPADGGHATIERKGMILMERPKQISDRVAKIDKQRAADQVRAKEAQLSGAPDGQFSRTDDPRTRPNIKKSYEPIPIPGDK